MSRRWLVVAVLCLAGDAAADPPPVAPLACECASSYILPARGATVARNARIWMFGTASSGGTLTQAPSGRPRTLQSYALRSFTADVTLTTLRLDDVAPGDYTFESDSYSTAFTVGSDADLEPPAPPQVRSVVVSRQAIDANHWPLVTRLDVDATFPREAELVRIVLRQPHGYGHDIVLFTTPGRLHLCNPAVGIDPGFVTASIQSVDLAGNESVPVEVTVRAVDIPPGPGESPCSERVHRQGYGYAYRRRGSDLTSLGFVLAIMAGIGLLAARAIRADGQSRANARAAVEQVSLLVAEPLARRARRMRVLEVGAYSMLIVAGWSAGFHAVAVLLAFVALAVDGLMKTRRVLKLLDDPQAGAELRGTQLTACAHGTHASIRAPRRAIARAKQQAVPKTVVL